MTNSILGGYDVMLEISEDLILNMIKDSFMYPPDELLFPFRKEIDPLNSKLGSLGGYAHLMISNLEIQLLQPNKISIELTFIDSALIITEIGEEDVDVALAEFGTNALAPFNGSISITLPIILKQKGSDPTNYIVTIDTNSDLVTGIFNFDAKSKLLVNFALSRLKIKMNFDDLVSQANSDLIKYVRGFKLDTLTEYSFRVKAGENGHLSEDGRFKPQFEKLDIQCYTNARLNRSLLIGGVLVLDNHSKADFSFKKSTAISADNNIALTVSDDALGMFAKEIINDLMKENSYELESFDVKIEEGKLKVNASAIHKESCIIIKVDLICELSFLIMKNVIKGKVNKMEISPHLDLTLTCKFLKYILGPLGLILEIEFEKTLNKVAESLVSYFEGSVIPLYGIKDTKPRLLSDISKPEIDLKDLVLYNEAITITALRNIELLHKRLKLLNLDQGEPIELAVTEGKPFDYHSKTCPIGTFKASTNLRSWKLPIGIIFSLIGYPRDIEWAIKYKDQISSLTKDKDSVMIEGVTTFKPQAPDGAVLPINRSVLISYLINQDKIFLMNDINDGTYGFTLLVRVKIGKEVFERDLPLVFEGATFDIQDNYYAYLAECNLVMMDDIKGLVTKWRPGEDIENSFPSIELGNLSSTEIVRCIAAVATSNHPQKELLISQVRTAIGNPFYKAIALHHVKSSILTEGKSNNF